MCDVTVTYHLKQTTTMLKRMDTMTKGMDWEYQQTKKDGHRWNLYSEYSTATAYTAKLQELAKSTERCEHDEYYRKTFTAVRCGNLDTNIL